MGQGGDWAQVGLGGFGGVFQWHCPILTLARLELSPRLGALSLWPFLALNFQPHFPPSEPQMFNFRLADVSLLAEI